MAVIARRGQTQPVPVGKEAAIDEILKRPPRSLWSDAWRRLRRNKMAMVGLSIIVFFYLLAIFADLISPYDPLFQYSAHTTQPPGWQTGDWRFVFGTDLVGRDVISRAIYGSRVSMTIGIVPVTITLLIGGTIGMMAGYKGGRLDNFLMRVADVFYAFPGLLWLIIVSVAFRESWLGRQMNGLLLLFVAIAVVGWEGTARLVRGQVLSVKEKEYVEAARMIGAGNARIMTRHIFPNILAPLIVSAAFGVPNAIFAEASLSFLGLGIRPPAPSWGRMILDGLALIYTQIGMVVLPAICIALVMLSFTFLGDGLRDALDPRMKI